MFRVETRKVVLMICLGVALLLICIAVVFAIDVHFSLDPWSDGEVEMLWFFLVGSMVFPGALRRYRAGRQAERKVPWYRRPELILCLIGLVSGLMFAVSVVQKWVWSVSTSNLGPSQPVIDLGLSQPLIIANGHLNVLAIATATIDLCWFALVIVLIFQALKQNQQRKNDSPQTT